MVFVEFIVLSSIAIETPDYDAESMSNSSIITPHFQRLSHANALTLAIVHLLTRQNFYADTRRLVLIWKRL